MRINALIEENKFLPDINVFIFSFWISNFMLRKSFKNICFEFVFVYLASTSMVLKFWKEMTKPIPFTVCVDTANPTKDTENLEDKHL